MKRCAILVAWCLAASLAQAAGDTPLKTYEAARIKALDLEIDSGQIAITGDAGGRAVVRTERMVPVGACTVGAALKHGTLTVRLEKGGWLGGTPCKVYLNIALPRTADLTIHVGSADVTVGEVDGALYFSSGSGDLDADLVGGRLQHLSGSGDVRVRGLTGDAEVKTTSGDIRLTWRTAPKPVQVDLRTGSGNSFLVFPPGARLRAEYQGKSGILVSDFDNMVDADVVVKCIAGSGDLIIKEGK